MPRMESRMRGNSHVRFGAGDEETCLGNGARRFIPTLPEKTRPSLTLAGASDQDAAASNARKARDCSRSGFKSNAKRQSVAFSRSAQFESGVRRRRIAVADIACQTKRSGVNPRRPRPVKRAPAGWAVIATPKAGPSCECPRRGVHYFLHEGSSPSWAETVFPRTRDLRVR